MTGPIPIAVILRELRAVWQVDEDLARLAAGVEDAWDKTSRPVPSIRTAREETNHG